MLRRIRSEPWLKDRQLMGRWSPLGLPSLPSWQLRVFGDIGISCKIKKALSTILETLEVDRS